VARGEAGRSDAARGGAVRAGAARSEACTRAYIQLGGVLQFETRSFHSSTRRLDLCIVCGIRWVVSLTKTARVELRRGRA